MNLEPNKDIVVREVKDQNLRQVLNDFSKTIDEIVNFGSTILVNTSNKNIDEYLKITVIAFLRNILEILDSISLLLKNSSVSPCDILLRTLLESYLYLKYILQSEPEKKALAYYYCESQNLIRSNEKVDPTSQSGKEFFKKLQNDELLKNIMPIQLDYQNQISDMKNTLAKNEFKVIEIEYKHLKKIKKGNPKWYSLFSGPDRIETLADRVNLSGIYEIFYRVFSKSTHSSDLYRRNIEITDGGAAIPQIRHAKEVDQKFSFTVSIGLAVYTKIIDKITPEMGHTFGQWYVENIRDKYTNIPKIVIK
jgi:hypothetical protein